MATIDGTIGSTAEAGTYPAVLVDLIPKTVDRDGEVGTFLVWTFGYTNPEGDSVTVQGTSSTNRGRRSKAYGWMRSLLGRDPKSGDTLGSWTDDAAGDWHGDSPLIGCACLVQVIETEDGYPKVETVMAPIKTGK